MTITAYEKNILDVSLLAAADYSSNQFHLVAQNTSGQAELASALGQRVIGVLQDDPDTAGDQCNVMVMGVSKVVAGGTIAWNAEVVTDANGEAVARSDNDQHVIGTALSSAVAGDIFPMLLTGPTVHPAYGLGSVLTIPMVLAGITDGDVLTDWIPGFAGVISAVSFAVTDPVTTGAKLSTLGLEIGAVAVTGGAVALTSANCTPIGAVVAGSAVTATNVFTATDTLSIVASSTTQFIEGQGALLISIY